MKTDSLPTVDSEAAGSTGTRSDHTFTVHHNSELSQHLAGMAREYLVAQLQGGQNPPPPAGYWTQPSQNQHSDYHLPPGEKVVHVSLSSGETTFHLPANTTFDTIRIIGHDLVLVQKDGTAIVLDDAGDRIPNIVVGDVDIPKVALEAAFTANGIQAAEGPSGSSTPASGGDFVGSEPGGIGNAYGVTGLLGAEGFNFTPTNVTVPPPPLPQIVVNSNPEPLLTVSESNLTAGTNGGVPGSDPDLALTSVSGNFSVDFTATPDVNGGTVTYSLSIPGNGTASGLVDSQTGQPDVLVQNGNTIEGHVGSAGGALAFTISVNPNTGVVTFTEDRAVIQAQTSNSNPSLNVVSIAAGVVTLTATITDGLGHHAAASIDLGKQISITDDGPHDVANAATVAGLTLSESDLTAGTNGVAGTTPNVNLTTVTGHFSGDFTDTSGADGLRSTTYALSINGGNGTASGFVDSQTGQADVLVQNGNVIEGHVGGAGGALAFTITLNPSTGDVTFVEDRAIENNGTGSTGLSLTAGLVTLTQTIVDNDGTSASASIDLGAKLSITDDTPVVTLSGAKESSLIVHEADLQASTNGVNGTLHDGLTSATGDFSTAFTDNFGADGQAKTGAISYALTVGNGGVSGFVDTQTGQADVLVQTNATTITGYVGSQASGIVAFTISVNAQGVVTFTEDRSVENNGTGSNGLAFATGSLTLSQTITDGDGSTGTNSIDISQKLAITDDTPVVTLSGATEPSVIVHEADLQASTNGVNGTLHDGLTSATGDFSTAFTDNFGADGQAKTGAISYALTVGNGGVSGFIDTQTGHADVLVQTSATTITGYVGSQASGIVAFTISVNAQGVVTFTEDRSVENNGTGSSGLAFATGSLTLTQTITDGDGSTASNKIDISQKLAITDDTPQISTDPSAVAGLTLSESHLTFWTNGVNGTDPDWKLTQTTGNFSAAFTDTPGADGLKSTSYALSIVGGNGKDSGLVDSQTGLHDILFQSGNTITGFVGHTGIVAFTITLDPSTGKVTFTEDRSVENNGTGATGISLAAGVVQLTQTITDGDGSTASASIDLGAKLSITDDGPQITPVAWLEPDLVVSESHLTAGTNGGISGSDPNSFLTHASGDFSFAFFDNPGADGLKSISYALTAGNGGVSGFVDTQTGLADVLVQVNATTIEGHVGNAGGALAFTITVDAFGIVTFTEDRAVVQSQDGHDPSHDLASFAAGALTLTQTLTDNDGTTTSASLDIGAQLGIADDGPHIDTHTSKEPTLTVSEADLQASTNGVDGTVHNGATTATGNFSGNFSDTFGADGAAKTGAVSYTLSVGNLHHGVGQSGLIDTQTGLNDVLVQLNATTIEGHVGNVAGALAFTISVDPTTGIVSFTEDRSVQQSQDGNDPSNRVATLEDGAVSLTQTITDGDGTTTSASLDIGEQLQIKDDGPKITVSAANAPVLTLSESNLTSTQDDNHTPGTNPNLNATTTTQAFGSAFTDVFGADGQAKNGAVSYALTLNGATHNHPFVDSGLVDTLSGTEIYLAQNGNTITGYVGASTHDPIAFTITLDPSTGNVTFTEDRSVENNNTGPAGVSINAGLVTLTQTITDGDGSTASKGLDISQQFSITDDTPVITLSGEAEPSLVVHEADLQASTNGVNGTLHDGLTSATGDFSIAFTDNFGADGQAKTGATSYALTVGNGGVSGFVDTQTGHADVLVQTNATTITGYVGSQASGIVAFTISVNAQGVVTFTEDRSVENNGTGSTGLAFAAGALTLTQTITDGDGSTGSKSIDIGHQLAITDDAPIIAPIPPAYVADVANSSFSGTWAPTFGADGQNQTTPVSLSMGMAPAGATYTVTDTHTTIGGHEVFEVQVGGVASYTFYEYTAQGASGAEMFAFSDEAGQNPFFTLDVLATGTYTFDLESTSLPGGSKTITFSSGGEHDFFYSANGSTSLTAGDYNPFPPNFGVPSNYDVLITAPGFFNDVGISNGKMGVDGNQLNSGETLAFNFGTAQTAVTIGVAAGDNAPNEEFEVTIWNANHTVSSTEFITQADGTTINVNASNWQGDGFNPWFSSGISEVDVTNIASGHKQDDQLSLTSISEGGTQSASVPPSQLDFNVGATDGDGSTTTGNLAVNLVAPPQAGTGPYAESVSESGLPQGSSPNPSAIVDTVQVSFTAGTDNANVTLDASALTTSLPGFQGLTWQVVNGVVEGFQGNTEVVSFAITGGSTIQAGHTGTVTITETLLAPIDGNNGGGAGDLGTLNVIAADANNSSINATDQVSVGVIDDKPVANPDTLSDNSGQIVSGNAAHGLFSASNTGGADRMGADGPATGDVVGVTSNNTNNVGTAGTAGGDGTPYTVQGAYGTLTLNQDGSYSYQANPDTTGLTGTKIDTFTYTIKDADGSTAKSTLTVDVNEVHPTAPAVTATVYEAGLVPGPGVTVTGSGQGPTTTLVQGQLTPSDANGDAVHVQSFTATIGGVSYTIDVPPGAPGTSGAGFAVGLDHGELKIYQDGTYSYQLKSPESASPSGSGVEAPDAVTVTLVDSDGNTGNTTLTFNIVDDKPLANPDTASATSGQTVSADATHGLFSASNTGGADKMGADGPATGNVVGVEAGNHPTDVVTTGVGTQITGLYGTLTLNQDGSYSYKANPDTTGLAGPETDTFTYTLKDGDGSTATSTLTINVNEVHPTAGAVTGTVYEAGLPNGSGQGPTTITQSGTLSFSETGDTVTVTSVNGQNVAQTVANTTITGTHGTLTINENGTYSYTLTSAENNNPTPDVFTYTVKDSHGNTTTSTLSFGIVDDKPYIESLNSAPASAFSGNSVTESWQPIFGADGQGSTPVTLMPNPTTLTDTHTQVTINSQSYELYKVVDGSTTYYEATVPTSTGSTIHAYSDAQGQDPFFQLQVSAGGSYTFTQDSATSTSGAIVSLEQAGSTSPYFYLNSSGTLTASAVPPVATAMWIDGFVDSVIQAPLNPSNNGLGVGNADLGSNETIAFHFGSAQNDIQIGVGKGNGNVAFEDFQVTIYNASGTQHATETITLADGAPIKIDAADWQGTLPSWFSSGVGEVDVTNLGTGSGNNGNGADKNLTLTSIDYATTPTSNSGETLHFAASITDGDGSTSAATDFSVTTPGGTAPTITGSGSDLAYEAGLPGGSNPGSSATPATVHTAVSVTAGSNPNVNVTLAAGGLTQSAGITWVTSANGQEIDGYQTQNGQSVEVLSLALVAGVAGSYTITETIDHALANNGASTGGDLGNLYVVATDASDPALTSFTPVAVGVVDDTPQIAGIQDAIVNNAAGSMATGTIATLISGADGFASTPVTVAATASDPTTFNGQALHYWGGAGTSSPNEIIAYTGTVDGSTTNAPSSNKQVFTFTADETAPGGHYVFNLLQPLTLPTTTQDVSYFYTANGGFTGALYSVQNVELAAVVSNDGNSYPLNHVGQNADGGVGVNHGFSQSQPDYYFTYGDQMTFSIQGNQADAAFTFNAVNTANHATVDYIVTYADGSSTSGSLDPDSYTNSAWTTPQAGDGSTIESVSFQDVGGGTSWTISLDSVTSEPSNQNLSFNVTTTDGDGSTSTAAANIAVDNAASYSVNYASNPGSLNGSYHEITEPAGTTSGGHLLAGDTGNDIFIPTFSGETLQAGTGHDIFVIPNISNVNEMITNFNSSNDTIDLTQLLSNVTASASAVGGTTSNYVEYNTSTGVLSVDTSGTGNHFQQVATLTTNGSPATAPNIVYQDSSHQAHLVAVHHNG